MRIVTLEEHFQIPSALHRVGLSSHRDPPIPKDMIEALEDLDTRRLQAMDQGEITVQVLSAAAPGADLLDGEAGIQFARETNDGLAAAVNRHPRRYAGFAHLPLRNPTASAHELKRAVQDLGFRGALINGTTQGLFLDDEKFAPLLRQAEDLDVPIYIHPAMPPPAVRDVYYGRLPKGRGGMLAMAGYGWHVETGLHVLRMVLNGTFDRHPNLKVIIGHMGETLPVMLDRAEQVFSNPADRVPVKETVLKHVWITTSGFFTLPPFQSALLTFGIDRILFSVDYPFAKPSAGTQFLKSLPISEADRAKIAFENADRLLRLKA